MNHSCSPNTSIEFATDCTAQLYVKKDIKAGDEITISYIDDTQDYEDRQFDLRTYGFACNCDTCEEEKNEENEEEKE